MLLSLIFPARCVLFMADEALCVYHVSGSQTHLVDTVPWDADDFEKAVGLLLATRCRGKPVVILSDAVEQHYRKERMPDTGLMGRAAAVRGYLENTFPTFPVRAAMKLKDKSPLSVRGEGEETLLPGNTCLMAALPESEALGKTVGAVRESFAQIDALALLPVESAGMVEALARRLAGREGRSQWTLFIGQHHDGGLRQIVTRGGELAVTRMTPILGSDMEPEAWSRDVINEFRATMGYLARFGFDASDGLNIIVICGSAATQALDNALGREGRLHLLSSLDAADALGLNIGPQEDVRYADPLHAAWAGRKRKITMPLAYKPLDDIARPRRIAGLAGVAMMGLIAILGLHVILDLYSQIEGRAAIDQARREQNVMQTVLEEQQRRIDAAGYDFDLVDASINAFEAIEKARLPVQDIIAHVGAALPDDMRLSALRLDKASPGTLELEMRMPGDVPPEDAYSRMLAIAAKLESQFPKATVDVSSDTADLGYAGRFSGEAGRGQRAASAPATARITIRGGLQ